MKLSATVSVGAQPRKCRQRRWRSQLDPWVDAEMSTRQLSFVENGRAMPSRKLVLRLSLHPKGPTPRIVNLGQSRAHLVARRRQQVALCARCSPRWPTNCASFRHLPGRLQSRLKRRD